VARLAAIAGWSVPIAGLFIGAGNVIGLIAAAHATRSKRVSGLSVVVAVVFFVVLFFVETKGLLGALLSATGQVLGASLLLTILLAPGWSAQKTGRMGASAANGIGQMLFVVFTFVFYISLELNFGFRAPAVLPVAGFLVAAAALFADRASEGAKRLPNNLVPAGIAAILLLLPASLWLSWTRPEPLTPAADNRAVRIVDYNLHSGFNTDGRLNLEALAQVIEAENPDVVGLQEVSRGWVIDGSVDTIEWLSQRLGMPYAFGPNEGHQWGNALLSRYPILSLGTGELPPESLRLRRGYIVAEIDAGIKDLWVINTHLHNVEEDSDIRMKQVPVLLYAWNNAARTVIMGDFNASSDAPEMVLLADAGFYDVGAFIGPDPGYTYYSADPYQRIDYFWITPDLVPALYDIPQTTASDHLPLAVTITIP
jgi:endonuclease/exonuclease/phosphatase family metal-dependent hydrolase